MENTLYMFISRNEKGSKEKYTGWGSGINENWCKEVIKYFQGYKKSFLKDLYILCIDIKTKRLVRVVNINQFDK